jgi:hypothetical protein
MSLGLVKGGLRSRQWATKLAHDIILESIAGLILTWQISPQSGKAESMLHAFAAKKPAQMLWALNANKSYYMSKALICIKLLENCDLSNRVKCNFEFVVQRSDWNDSLNSNPKSIHNKTPNKLITYTASQWVDNKNKNTRENWWNLTYIYQYWHQKCKCSNFGFFLSTILKHLYAGWT